MFLHALSDLEDLILIDCLRPTFDRTTVVFRVSPGTADIDRRVCPADDLMLRAVPVARTAQHAREAGAVEGEAKALVEEAGGTFTP